MDRIGIVGNSGAGKTTLAKKLASSLALEFVELDAIYHQPNWEPLPEPEFRRAVSDALPIDGRWVVEGNYKPVADIVADRADSIVWLDLPRLLSMRRLTVRTVRRFVQREELWNGNREPIRNFTRWDPDENILRWAWTNHHKYQERFANWTRDGLWADLTVHRLRSTAEVSEFLVKYGSYRE